MAPSRPSGGRAEVDPPRYDAVVVDKENGEPHIVKRMDRPRIRVIAELLGSGTLPRRDLKDAAQELSSDQAALF